jgi:hypothetical protein
MTHWFRIPNVVKATTILTNRRPDTWTTWKDSGRITISPAKRLIRIAFEADNSCVGLCTFQVWQVITCAVSARKACTVSRPVGIAPASVSACERRSTQRNSAWAKGERDSHAVHIPFQP